MIRKGLYRHFKGQYYKVTDVARHSETEELLVIYTALYGDKKSWARPMSHFTEMLQHDKQCVQRFTWCEQQSEVLEVAILDVVDARQSQFEMAFAEAESIISSADGYITHRLERCIEKDNRYILLVEWQTLAHHTIGFRGSVQYRKWAQLLHPFYNPFPLVQHFQSLY